MLSPFVLALSAILGCAYAYLAWRLASGSGREAPRPELAAGGTAGAAFRLLLGTGTWGPPVRFGSEPELTVIRLSAKTA